MVFMEHGWGLLASVSMQSRTQTDANISISSLNQPQSTQINHQINHQRSVFTLLQSGPGVQLCRCGVSGGSAGQTSAGNETEGMCVRVGGGAGVCLLTHTSGWSRCRPALT